MSLTITKLSGNVWKHTYNDTDVIIGKGMAKISDNDFILKELNGQAPIPTFDVSVITLVDDTTGTTYPVFATGEALSIQLKALQYVGFQIEGEVIANLNDILDVEITAPSNDQALIYESASGLWKNQDQSGGGGGSVLSQIAIGGADQSSVINDNFKAIYAARGFPPTLVGHTNDCWFSAASATTNQRIMFLFGRIQRDLKMIEYMNYYNTASANPTPTFSSRGINSANIYAITDNIIPSTTHGDLTGLTAIFSGNLVEQTVRNLISQIPINVETLCYGIVVDGNTNHGDATYMALRKILCYI